MVSSKFLASALFAGIALAQGPVASFNSSVVDSVAGEVDATTRSQWCNGQHNSCGTLCSGTPSQNDCNPDDLSFACKCSSNNSSPALQYYQPTMLSYVCNQARGDCLARTANSQSEQQNCMDTFVCGNSSVDAFASAASSSSAMPSATASSSASGQPSSTGNAGSPGATPSSGAGDALRFSQEVTTGIFGAALLGVMGLAL